MKKIIALVDGSVYSQSVCDHAAWMAKHMDPAGAAVEVLHVLGRRQHAGDAANLSGNIALGARTALLEELSELDVQTAKLAQKRGRAILEDAKERIEKAGGGEVTERLRIGDIVETVAETETDADMVVIGKRGEDADFAKLHLGSNLERIVRSCHKPILVASRAFKPVEKFLIAYDGGASSLKAVEHVARSPLCAGLKCRLLMVGTDNPENRKKLGDAQAMLKAGGHAVEADIIPGQPEAVISDVVEKEAIDLLIMGAYGHSRIRSLVIGSTTSEMVRLCKVSMILFR